MVNKGEHKMRYPERKKQLILTGDLRLAPAKARARLGSEMTASQRRAQMRAEQILQERRRKQIQSELDKLLSMRPDASQLSLPQTKGPNANAPVSLKALRLLGDSRLEEESRRRIPTNAKINAKVILLLGDKNLLPRKARWMLGDDDLTMRRPPRSQPYSASMVAAAAGLVGIGEHVSNSDAAAFSNNDNGNVPSCFGGNSNGNGITHSIFSW